MINLAASFFSLLIGFCVGAIFGAAFGYVVGRDR